MSDDDDEGGGRSRAMRSRHSEFDCPECNANNPYEDGFKIGDQVRCFYCGSEFKVFGGDGSKVRLKLL